MSGAPFNFHFLPSPRFRLRLVPISYICILTVVYFLGASWITLNPPVGNRCIIDTAACFEYFLCPWVAVAGGTSRSRPRGFYRDWKELEIAEPLGLFRALATKHKTALL